MKTLLLLNIFLLGAAIVLCDIVLGICGVIGVCGFISYVANNRNTMSTNVQVG